MAALPKALGGGREQAQLMPAVKEEVAEKRAFRGGSQL